METIPKLTLVGAGPGDPELITLKGVKALEAADVVLYDALANDELLSYCKPEAIKLFVGKRAGLHHYQQHVINQMIVDHALQHGHVVRLKGGDPYIFGRGHEELEYAEKHGIEVSLVPGISSSISVPSLNQIPLTRRGINESFWVMTGTTRKGRLSEDIELASKSNATSVILMGMKKLDQILSIYATNGKGNIPAAIIQNGSRPDQKVVIGTVNNLEQLAKEKEMAAPAIIVIGETVSLGVEKLQREIAHQTVPV